MLLNEGAVLRIGKLTADDFAHAKHRAVFEAVLGLVDRGATVDCIAVEAELVRRGTVGGVGGLAGLSEYLMHAAVVDVVPHHAAIIRDGALGRRLRLAASGTATRLGSGADWQGELVGLRRLLDDLEESAHVDPPTLREAVASEMHELRNPKPGVVGLLTGIGIERACPSGIPVGYVTTIFGESGSFKSTTVNNIVWNVAAAGHGVLHVSWEDSSQLTAQRFIAQQTGVGYGRLAARQVSESERLGLSVSEVANATAERIVMASETAANMDAVIRAARFYKRTKGISMVVVDYLQIMDYDGRTNRHEVISDAVKRAQRSAKQDGLAYVLVSQVKTDMAERDDPRPKMEDCFGSGAIRMFTKLGLSVFRPSKYCRVPSPKGAYSNYFEMANGWPEGKDTFLREVYPRILEIGLDKNVMGEAPVVIPVLVDPPTGRIEALDTGRVL